jgi:hypothetical protein
LFFLFLMEKDAVMNRALTIGLIAAAFCAGAVATSAFEHAAAAPPPRQRIFQLRTYYPREGQMEAVRRRFREHGVALFRKHGIEVIGFWTPHDAKDKDRKLVYMIAWPSMEAAKAAWKSFGGDPDRKRIWADYNKDGDIVDHWEAVYLDPIEFSPLQ